MPPNIIIINTHDTGRHFGCYGAAGVHTPAIDRLAAAGVRCDRMFATSSICSPSRGSLLTGRYPQSNGLVGLAGPGWESEMNDPRQHLSHLLRDRGYRTVFVGLQHETGTLSTLGFDDVSRAHATMKPDAFRDEPNGERPELDVMMDRYGRNAPDTARDAAEFLDSDAARAGPFYLQVGFFETHTPYLWGGCEADDSLGLELPDYTRSDLDDTWRDLHLRPHLAGFQGSVRRVDEAVGIIAEAIDRNGLADDTIVVFTVDHGPELPRAKWTLFDAGLHVACIMHWPGGGVVGGGVCDQLLSVVDVAPTLAELAGLSLPENVEGRSFAASMTGAAGGSPPTRDAVFALFSYAGLYAARTERYKLIRHLADDDDSMQLYDLAEDPLELRDVSDDPRYAEAREEMCDRLWRWFEDVDDPIREGRERM